MWLALKKRVDSKMTEEKKPEEAKEEKKPEESKVVKKVHTKGKDGKYVTVEKEYLKCSKTGNLTEVK